MTMVCFKTTTVLYNYAIGVFDQTTSTELCADGTMIRAGDP